MKNYLIANLIIIFCILVLAQTGEAMWKDDLKDASLWSVSYLINDEEIGKGSIYANGVLHIPMDFRNATVNRFGRDINIQRPRWISFKLKTTGSVSAENLKLRLCLKSPNAPFSFLPKFKQITDGWAEFEADIHQPDSLINVWRFYGLSRLSQMTITVEKPSGGATFELLLTDLTFRYGDDIVENYKPTEIELKPADQPLIAVCLNRAGEYYQVEEILREYFPSARISIHAFRGPTFTTG